MSLAACEARSTRGVLGNAPAKPGNYSGESSQPQTLEVDETDPNSNPEDQPDDEDTDDSTDVNRTVENESAAEIAARADAPQWNQPASLGTVRGHVVDAVTGAVVEGTVSTTAKCAGTGCSRVRGNTNAYVTPLQAGDFVFDADPPKPAKGQAKPARLTLSPTTSFTIAATGYEPLVIAHGPQAPAKTDNDGRPFTELPTLYLCPQGALDSDVDGICDAAEAGYKTDPQAPDEDKDALSDSLELLGHPKDSNTVYDIRNLGADPHVRDIFIAVRYTKSSQHSDEALELVKQAFAAAPPTVDNPAGSISLHIVSDDRPISGIDDVKVLKPVWTTFRRLTKKYFQERPPAFHYALFANRYYDPETNNTSSGLSYDFGAAEFIVTLGAFPNATPLQQAGTFMHELGHNLSLRHGGDDDDESKPGYLSIMNYNYQFTGIERTQGAALDFARIQTAGIDESTINENQPFKPAGSTTLTTLQDYINPRVWTGFDKTGTPVYTKVSGNLGGALDLNLNGELEAATCIAFDFVQPRKPYGTTRDDWSTLKFDGGAESKVGDVAPQPLNVRIVDTGRPTHCLSVARTGGPVNDEDMTVAPSDEDSPSEEDTTDTTPDEVDIPIPTNDRAGAGAAEVPAPDSEQTAAPNMSEPPPMTAKAPMCYAPTKAPKPQKTTPATSQTRSTAPDVDPTDPDSTEPEASGT